MKLFYSGILSTKHKKRLWLDTGLIPTHTSSPTPPPHTHIHTRFTTASMGRTHVTAPEENI